MPRVAKPQPLKARGAYHYGVRVAALAAGTQATPAIIFDNDSDFICTKAEYFVDIAGAAQTDSTRVVPLISVLLQPGGSGRRMMQEAVPLPAVFGTGALPFIFPVRHTFVGGTTLNITLTNYSAATAYANLYLVFSGMKVYYS